MTMIDQLVPDHIRTFEPYYPSQPDHVLMARYGLKRLIRLNNNENPLGPPDEIKNIVREFQPESVPIYPNGDCHDLRQILANRFDKSPDQFLVGNGSCEVITSVIKAFCQPGDNIITADKTFAVYEWVAQFSGIEARLVPLKDFTFDPDAMLRSMDSRTKILFVCNPNNPTGTYWDRDTLVRFMDQVKEHCMVVVDEAYCEYVSEPDFPDAMALGEQYPNLIIFRTFSKMFALAALRIGYLYASPKVADLVRRTHIVYSVNTLAQRAASAAMTCDPAFIHQTRAMVTTAKEILCPLFDRLGLKYLANQGNFLMVRTPVSDTRLYRMMLAQGILIRTMTGFRFPNWIRVTLAREPEMTAFAKTFEAALSKK